MIPPILAYKYIYLRKKIFLIFKYIASSVPDPYTSLKKVIQEKQYCLKNSKNLALVLGIYESPHPTFKEYHMPVLILKTDLFKFRSPTMSICWSLVLTKEPMLDRPSTSWTISPLWWNYLSASTDTALTLVWVFATNTTSQTWMKPKL